MTNEEKAKELANYYSGESDYKESVGYDCAIEMAEWKDQQFQEAKKQLIEKTYEWVKENIHDYYVTCGFEEWFDAMFEDFREAMEVE